jgi:hypothetical protein
MNHKNTTIQITPPITAEAGGGAINRLALVLVLIGLGCCLGTFGSDHGLARFSFAGLWGFTFFWTVVLGCLFFVALQHLTGSVWSVVLRRPAELLAGAIWLAALLFGVVLIAALMENNRLWPWLHGHQGGEFEGMESKAKYLNLPFFVIRAIIYFGLWILFARYFVRRSLAQDQRVLVQAQQSLVQNQQSLMQDQQSLKQDLQPSASNAASGMKKISGPFILLFAFTVTFASFDWLMSLDPHWFSSIYGVYVFAGMFPAALAAITIAVIYLRHRGRLGRNIVNDKHLYSLGGLLFAFSCFWAYIAFSQYMLIWYSNLPEETEFFIIRLTGDWKSVSILLVVLRFIIPFIFLLSRAAKINPRRLIWVSILILLGELLDLYWLIMPQLYPDGPVLSFVELGPVLVVTGILIGYFALITGKESCLATGDPLFAESCRFHL